MREAMDKEDTNLMLTAAVSPSSDVIQKAYNIPKLSEYLDYVSVMTYDYHGQWDKQTGHVAPIYEHPDDLDSTFNLVSSLKLDLHWEISHIKLNKETQNWLTYITNLRNIILIICNLTELYNQLLARQWSRKR